MPPPETYVGAPATLERTAEPLRPAAAVVPAASADGFSAIWRHLIGVLVGAAISTLIAYLVSRGIPVVVPPAPPVQFAPAPAPQIFILPASAAGFQTATAEPAAGFKAAFPHPARDRIRAKLIDAAVKKGATAEQAEEAVAVLESERPLIDWFTKGGFLELLKAVLEIIAALK